MCLQVACMVHAQHNALSYLAGVPSEQLAGECSRMPRQLRQSAAAVTNALSAAETWKLALLCVNAAALALGHRASVFPYRTVFSTMAFGLCLVLCCI